MNKIIQQYHLQESIGTDSFGFQIYKARHMVTKQYYSLKSISSSQFSASKQFQQKILNQVKIIKKFDHVNIIKFIKMLKTVHNIYLVYQYCDGGTLYDKIKKTKLTETQQINYMRQLSIALRQIHKKNILHNDINPKTIMFGSNNNLKITSFINAKILFQNSDEEIISSKITPQQIEYMAPELKKLNQKITLKADVYSLGIVFYFIKFGRNTDIETFLCNQERPTEITISVIIEMLQKQPNKRILLQDINEKLLHQSKSPSNNSKISRESSLKNQNLLASKRKQTEENIFSSKEISPNKFQSPSTRLKQQALLKIPSKKQPRESSKNQSETRSIRSAKSGDSSDKSTDQTSSQNFRKVLFDRSKYNYLSLVVKGIIDLDVNQLSSKLSYLLFKKARIIANKLAYRVSRSENTLLSVKSVKRSQEYDSLLKIVIKQVQELNQSFKNLKRLISQEKKLQNDKILESQIAQDDILNEPYVRRVIRQYLNEVLQVINNSKKQQQSISKKRLLHLNNVADCLQFDKFFEDYINDSVVKLTDQIYFQQVQKLQYKQLYRIVSQKIL